MKKEVLERIDTSFPSSFQSVSSLFQ